MKKLNLMLAGGLFLTMAAATTPAQAAVTPTAAQDPVLINFSSVAVGSYSSVTVGDYVFSQFNGDLLYVFDGVAGRSLGDLQRGGFDNGSVFNITRLDGLAFTVNSLVFGASQGASGRIALGDYGQNQTDLSGVGADGTAYTGQRAVLTNTPSLFVDTYASSGAVGLRNLSISLASAVPEPTTWAMMLVGFAMVGAAARYRRRGAKITYA